MMRKTIKMVGSANISPSDGHPYPVLRDSLGREGLTPTSDRNSEYFIAMNHNQKLYEDFIQRGGQYERAVLIRLEPDSVFPLQYRASTLRKYGLVITPGSILDRKSSRFFVGWPYQYNLNPTRPVNSDPSLQSVLENASWRDLFNVENWDSRPNILTMIAANKVSPLKSANYSLRRRLASELPIEILEVYGPLWTDAIAAKAHHRLAVAVTNLRQGTVPNPVSLYGSLFRSYPTARGTVHDKHSVLRETKFSLVIENSNSYVSEKLIDAIVNGSIPIYVGPNLEKVGLPTEIAIHSSGDPKEVIEIVKALDSRSAETMLTAMREFLTSSLFLNFWTEQSVYENISRQIAEYFRRLAE